MPTCCFELSQMNQVNIAGTKVIRSAMIGLQNNSYIANKHLRRVNLTLLKIGYFAEIRIPVQQKHLYRRFFEKALFILSRTTLSLFAQATVI